MEVDNNAKQVDDFQETLNSIDINASENDNPALSPEGNDDIALQLQGPFDN